MGQHPVGGAPSHKQREREQAQLGHGLEVPAERLFGTVELAAPHHGVLRGADLLPGVELGARGGVRTSGATVGWGFVSSGKGAYER